MILGVSLSNFDEDVIFTKLMKCAAPFLVLMLVGIVGGISLVYFLIVLPYIYPTLCVAKILHLGFAIWILFNIWFNYFRIMFVDPGSPNKVFDTT